MAAVQLMGLAFTGYQTLNNTMLMAESDPEYYGRVMSLMMMTFSGMSLMAAPLGMLADRIGPVNMFALQGGVIVTVMLLIALTKRGYTFGRKVPKTFAERQASEVAAGDGGR